MRHELADSQLHIMVVVEPLHAFGLDWPRTRREAGERGAIVSLLEASDSGARWLVPAGPASTAASQVAIAAGSRSAIIGIGGAVVDKIFEAEALVPEIQVSEVRLYVGARLETELNDVLKAETTIQLRVFDSGAFRAAQSIAIPPRLPVGLLARGQVFHVPGEVLGSDSVSVSEERPIEGVLTHQRQRVAPIEVLQTGLKSIDLLAPFVKGGHNGILGLVGTGRLPVTMELLLRLGTHGDTWPIFGGRVDQTSMGENIIDEMNEVGLADTTAFVFGQNDRALVESLRVAEVALTMAEHQRDDLQSSTLLFLYDMFEISSSTSKRMLRPANMGQTAGKLHEPQTHSLPWPWGRDGAKNGAVITFLYAAEARIEEPDSRTYEMELDSLIELSPVIAWRGLYPAVDPLTSMSRALTAEVVGAEHYRIAQELKSLLATQIEIQARVDEVGMASLDPDDKEYLFQVRRMIRRTVPRPEWSVYKEYVKKSFPLEERIREIGTASLSDNSRILLSRGEKIRQFLSQNTHVATRFTRITGSSVPIRDTVESFGMILRGDVDHIDAAAFFNVGGFSDVEQRWAAISRKKSI